MAQRRALVAGLIFLSGALILALALPRLLASALLAMRDPVILQMDAGERVPKAGLLGVIASRELALEWAADRETHDERGTALARLAFEEATQSAAQRATLGRAVSALGAGLALAPAAPRDWMQLGYLLVLLEGDPNRKAAEALLLSIRTGAFQAPDLLQRRLFWSLAHWPFYDDQERAAIGRQIRLAWEVAPGELADLALYVPDFFAPIAAALEAAPGAQERFTAALAFATPLSAEQDPSGTAGDAAPIRRRPAALPKCRPPWRVMVLRKNDASPRPADDRGAVAGGCSAQPAQPPP